MSENEKNTSFFFVGGGSGGHTVATFSIFQEVLKDFSVNHSSFYYFSSDKDGTPAYKIFSDYLQDEIISFVYLPKVLFRGVGSFVVFFPISVLLFSLSFFKSFYFLFLQKFYRKKVVVLISTGGSTALAPVIAAFLLRIPTIIHEQTSRPGIVNCISSLFSRHICISFLSSKDHFPFWVKKSSLLFTGYPLRSAVIKHMSNQKLDLQKSNPSLLFLGGGNGSMFINQLVERSYPVLKKDFFIYHQTGNTNFFLKDGDPNSYQTFNFLNDIHELIAQSSCVICRAGAGMVCELIAFNKPSIFFPLKLSRFSEQRYNAEESAKYIPCTIFMNTQFDEQKFYFTIRQYAKLPRDRVFLHDHVVEKSPIQSGTGAKNIVSVIKSILK